MDNCSTYTQLIAGLGLNSSVQHMLECYFKIKNFSLWGGLVVFKTYEVDSILKMVACSVFPL